MIKRLCFLTLLCLLYGKGSLAVNGTASGNGNWNNASTWLFNGVHRLPTCGDTVFIPANRTVTINSQVSYTSCSATLYIIVAGTLAFTNGNKLDLPCFSTVDLYAGGLIYKSTAGGGNSTMIKICGIDEWSAGDGPLPGPAILGGGNPLPVKLLSFKATYHENSIIINWATATEVNNDYFILDHSVNGKTFTRISQVAGSGNSNTVQSYSETHPDFSNGINYYQLTQVDINGLKHTYPVISVKAEGNQNISLNVYPASHHHLNIFNNECDAPGCKISICDITGKPAFEFNNLLLRQGSNTLELTGAPHMPGIYFVSILIDNNSYTKKLILN